MRGYAPNDDFNEALFGEYRARNVPSKVIRKKIEEGKLPALPMSKFCTTKPMCLAWHTKKVCNGSCPLHYDHVKYSPAEYRPLKAWCAANYPETRDE